MQCPLKPNCTELWWLVKGRNSFHFSCYSNLQTPLQPQVLTSLSLHATFRRWILKFRFVTASPPLYSHQRLLQNHRFPSSPIPCLLIFNHSFILLSKVLSFLNCKFSENNVWEKLRFDSFCVPFFSTNCKTDFRCSMHNSVLAAKHFKREGQTLDSNFDSFFFLIRQLDGTSMFRGSMSK